MNQTTTLPNVIILGPQGSGKGTQAQKLAEQYGYTIIGMGQLLRQRAEVPDEFGQQIRTTLAQGNLVSDEALATVLREGLSKIPVGTPLIYDGVPRDRGQVDIFEQIMTSHHDSLPVVLSLQLDRDDALERIAKRRVCAKCQTVVGLISNSHVEPRCPNCGATLELREDDRAEAVERRLNLFYSETIPVIEYYRNLGRLIEIDASGSVPEVTDRIIAALHLK